MRSLISLFNVIDLEVIDFDFVHLEVIDFLVLIDLSIAIDSGGVIVRFFVF